MEVPKNGNERLLAEGEVVPQEEVLITHSAHEVNIDEAFDEFLEGVFNLPKGLSGIALDMASMEIFERAFKIYEHSPNTDPRNPIPLVTRNKKLDYYKLNPVRDEMKSLLRMQAPRRLNMSLMDILDLDTYTYDAVLSALRETGKDETMMTEDILDELDGLSSAIPQKK